MVLHVLAADNDLVSPMAAMSGWDIELLCTEDEHVSWPYCDVIGAAQLWRVGQGVLGGQDDARLSAELSPSTRLHCMPRWKREQQDKCVCVCVS